ncbi:hypothetical protein DRN73_09490 [Candidatus Pacearchaeota archaeon]|nr:MAG: hypothetical protein DRN73_09490 [Candidatus Pacearchaeota archaeon]
MGCIICNILELFAKMKDKEFEKIINRKKYKHLNSEKEIEKYKEALKNEICNDIAINHPEMVKRINQIYKKHSKKED